MSVVRIPSALQHLTDGSSEVSVNAETVLALIQNLEQSYPGIKERLLDEAGELRRFVNIYVNDEDIRFLNGIKTALESDTEVSIVPAVAGG